MTPQSRKIFLKGLLGGLPFMPVLIPFGLLFGVLAMDAGLALGQAMGMTMLVIAGASQFTALQMMVDNASFWLIVAAALAVNLRMAMYSAALVPYLGAAPLWQRVLVAYANFDQTYAVSVAAYDANPNWTVSDRIVFFFGVATPIVPVWIAASLVGALIGQAIPVNTGMDFALPITFIALFAPMLKTIPHLVAAAVSIVFGLIFSTLPSGLGLLAAGVLAMFAGAVTETLLQGRIKS